MQQNNTRSLDSLIAELNMLTTDFIFNKRQCIHKATEIVNQLNEICHHIELAFFPEQQTIYLKMLKVWQSVSSQVQQSIKENEMETPSIPVH